MKQLIKISSVFFLASVLFFSCDKDDVTPEITPEITNVVAENHGDGSSEIAIGGTISVDFDAKTRSGAKLDFYHIEIHDHPTSGLIEDEYKIIDDDFKDKSTFKGLINAHVHEHITVPDTANLGDYHVVVIVVDEDGNSSDTEALETHIKIVE